MPEEPIVVPVQLDALVVNENVLGRDSFRWWQFNYFALKHYNSPEPMALGGSVGGQGVGVYLHWTLPAALRHGAQEPTVAHVTYPLVPNRWLLVRFSGSTQHQASAWVIESDCPDGTKVTGDTLSQNSMYLPDDDVINKWRASGDPIRARAGADLALDSPSVQVVNIGMRFPLGTWKERAAKGDLFLSAVAPSNPVFSIYMAHNIGVFSLYDDLKDIDKDTLSYFLLGWYSNPSKDIMAGWTGDKTSTSPYAALLSGLNWGIVGGSETQAVTSLYQGAVFSIDWNRTGSAPTGDPLQTIRDSKKLNAGIGNTTIDAFIALIEQQLNDPAKAKLLRAFQYGYLQQLNQPNGDALLEEKIRQEWFGNKAGGYSWTIVENKSDGTTSVNLTRDEEAWLSELNKDQADLDSELATLFSLQWQLHSLWLKQGFLSDTANTFSGPPDGIPSGGLQKFQDRLATQLDPGQQGSVAAELVAQFAIVQGLLKKVPQPVWARTQNAQKAFQLGIQSFAAAKKLDSAKSLKAVAAPRYWQANNPVIIISGVAPSPSSDAEEELNVRLGSHLITGFRVNGELITAAKIGAAFPTIGNLEALPSAALSLLQEFFLLDPSNAEVIAAATGQNASQVRTVMSAHDPSTYQGPLPDLPLTPWQQPWNPMFLEWSAEYKYVPFKSEDTSWWTFDGTDYHYTPGSNTPEVVDRTIGGISLLSPHAQFIFGSRLDDFVRKYGTNTELAQIDAWVKHIYGWQFLAQELTGFNQLLSLRDSRAFRRPAPNDVIGENSLPVAALTGYVDGSIPSSLALPSPYQGQVNNVPFFPNGPAILFRGARQGQLYLTDLYLYDKFGRELFVIESESQSGLFDYETFPLQIDSAFEPDEKIATNVASVVQVPPRILQHSRLDFRLLDGRDDTKVYGLDSEVVPIGGWVLPNHLDKSILIYAPDGTSLGEFRLVAAPDGTKSGEWQPPPPCTMTLDEVGKAAPHLLQMIDSPSFKEEANFLAFLLAIDATLWTTDPLGNRVDQNLSVLVGRPLALVRARLQFQLDGYPINDTGWASTFNVTQPDFLSFPFSIRLGDQASRQDGVIGYFSGTDYNVFNSVVAPQTKQGYVKPIGPLGLMEKGNYLTLTFAQETYSYVTILVDPRGAIHATTGILPVKELDIPQQFVDQALTKMELSFHMGPILTSRGPTPNQEGKEPAFAQAISYPRPVEENGTWSWWESDAAKGAWTGYDLVPASPDAQIKTVPNSLREGVFHFVSSDKNLSATQILPKAGAPPMTLLLKYLFSSDPDPIQVSFPETQISARLNIAVFKPSQPVYCSQIGVAVPVGTDAPSLFASSPSGSINTNKWTLTSQFEKKGSEIGLDSQQIYSKFTYNCRSSADYLIDYNLVLGVFGPVNQVSGPFTIKIFETSGTTNDLKTFTNKIGAFALNKYVPQFYLHNFVAVSQTNQSIPATDFASGADITFRWESNGTYFQLFMKDLATPIYADKKKVFTLKGGVTRDTTFILVASVTGKPDSDSSGGGYEPIYLYDSLSITVADPIIDETLTVKGKLSALSELSVKGVDFAALAQKVNDQATEIGQVHTQLAAIHQPITGAGYIASGGSGDRTFSQAVTFPVKLDHTPTVMVSLAGINCYGPYTRVRVWTQDVGPNGFTVIGETWADSKVNGVWYSWTAV